MCGLTAVIDAFRPARVPIVLCVDRWRDRRPHSGPQSLFETLRVGVGWALRLLVRGPHEVAKF